MAPKMEIKTTGPAGPNMGSQVRPWQPPKRPRQGRGRGANGWGRRRGINTDWGNLPRGRGKVEDGEPMFGAEDEESRPTGATSQEAEARLRTGSHCLGLKMRNQDRPAGATSPQEAEARVRTGSHCLVPKMKNQVMPWQPLRRTRTRMGIHCLGPNQPKMEIKTTGR